MKLNKPFRTLLSVFVTVAMLATSTITAFCTTSNPIVSVNNLTKANNISYEQSFKIEGLDIRKELSKATDKVTPELVSIATKDYRNLESIGLTMDILKIDHIERGKNIVYRCDINDSLSDYITVCEKGKTLILDFYEGNIHNQLEVKDNGDMLIDGFLIGSTMKSYSPNGGYDGELSPNARNRQFSKTPFKGKADDYNKKVRYYQEYEVAFGHAISSLAVTLIATTLLSFVTLGTFEAISVSLLLEAAGNMKYIAERYSPSSPTGSFKITVKEYPTSIGTDRYYKHEGEWYAQTKFGGTAALGDFYEYNFFS